MVADRGLRESQRLSASEPIGPETALLDEGLALDSVSLLDFLLALEREFGCRVEESEITPENLGTVARVAELVGRKASGDETVDA